MATHRGLVRGLKHSTRFWFVHVCITTIVRNPHGYCRPIQDMFLTLMSTPCCFPGWVGTSTYRTGLHIKGELHRSTHACAQTSKSTKYYPSVNQLHLYVDTVTHMQPCLRTYIHTYVHTYTYVQTYILTYLLTCIHICSHTHTLTYLPTYLPTNIHITHMHTYVHTYIHKRTNIRAYMYVHMHVIAGSRTCYELTVAANLLTYSATETKHQTQLQRKQHDHDDTPGTRELQS